MEKRIERLERDRCDLWQIIHDLTEEVQSLKCALTAVRQTQKKHVAIISVGYAKNGGR